MPGPAGETGVLQGSAERITDLEVRLAAGHLADVSPRVGVVVDAVDQRVVHPFGDLVAENGDVLDAGERVVGVVVHGRAVRRGPTVGGVGEGVVVAQDAAVRRRGV